MIDLIHGDCLEKMKDIPDNSIDLILTDPPYGMNFQSNHSKRTKYIGHRHKKIEGDDKIFSEWLTPSFSLLREGGAILMFCNWETSGDWRIFIEEAGFHIKSQVIWDRMHHGMGDLFGSFAPMHDIIWYAIKGIRKFVGTRPKSIIRVKRPSPTEDNGHPTCKPVPLMKKLIEAVDDGKTKTIFDPFMGSGSTGVACVNLKRNFIGIEKDAEYFKIAQERIEEAEKMKKMEIF